MLLFALKFVIQPYEKKRVCIRNVLARQIQTIIFALDVIYLNGDSPHRLPMIGVGACILIAFFGLCEMAGKKSRCVAHCERALCCTNDDDA